MDIELPLLFLCHEVQFFGVFSPSHLKASRTILNWENVPKQVVGRLGIHSQSFRPWIWGSICEATGISPNRDLLQMHFPRPSPSSAESEPLGLLCCLFKQALQGILMLM
jgi:hypothetical protein